MGNMIRVHPDNLAELNNMLSALDGANLELRLYKPSHSMLVFGCNKLPKGYAELLFAWVYYFKCYTQLHEIKFRIATREEIEWVRNIVSYDSSRYFGESGIFALDSREGKNLIYANYVQVFWGEKENDAHFALTNRFTEFWKTARLGQNNPSLSEI